MESGVVETRRLGETGDRHDLRAGGVLHVHRVSEPRAAAAGRQGGLVRGGGALGGFRPGARFGPWLRGIVAKEALNTRRGRGRRARLELRVFEDRPAVGTAPSTEDAVLALEGRQVL